MILRFVYIPVNFMELLLMKTVLLQFQSQIGIQICVLYLLSKNL
jgi:hypothetical protein